MLQLVANEGAEDSGCPSVYQESFIQYSQPKERAAKKARQHSIVEWVHPLFVVIGHLENAILEQMSKQESTGWKPTLDQVSPWLLYVSLAMSSFTCAGGVSAFVGPLVETSVG